MVFPSLRNWILPKAIALPLFARSALTSRGHKMMTLSTNYTRCKKNTLTCICYVGKKTGPALWAYAHLYLLRILRYSRGVMSPERHVRTRLYFTSESHVHSLLSILRYGALCDVSTELQLHFSSQFALMSNTAWSIHNK